MHTADLEPCNNVQGDLPCLTVILFLGTRVGSLKLVAVALLQAQRQSDSIRLENLSKRALADWKVRVPACATAFCINTVFV